jgi:thiamine-monophosphate kinase
MGATPLYFTLALSLPSVDKKWLADFSQSLKALAKQFQLEYQQWWQVVCHGQ